MSSRRDRSQTAASRATDSPIPQAEAIATSLTDPPLDTTSRSIAAAALLVMAFFVLSRVTGLVRDMVIAAQFDLGADLDAYQAAFRIPDLLFEVVAGGALGSAFIPTFAHTLVHTGHRSAWLLFSRVLNWITLLLLALTALAALLALPVVQWVIAPDFPLAQQQLTATLMRWLLLSTVVFGASGLCMGALNARQHFLLPAAAPVVRNGAIILAALWLAPPYGIFGLVVGAVVGAVGHLMVQIPGLRRHGAQYTFSLDWKDPGLWEVVRLMGPRVLGLIFVHLNFIVNTALASGLAPGSLSALTYAWRLMLLPLGIFAQAVGIAAFPTFAAQVAASQQTAMRRTCGRLLRIILFMTIPAAIGLWMLRVPLVQILYERGHFTHQSTMSVALALQYYALGLMAHAGVEIIVRAFYALHDTLTPVVVGIAAMLLNIVLSFWWVQGLSFGGLALANSVATSAEMVALLWLLHARMGGLDLPGLALSLGRSSAAALCMGAALWLWLWWLEGGMVGARWLAGGWLAGGGGLLLGGLVYLLASITLHHPELRLTLQLVQRRA